MHSRSNLLKTQIRHFFLLLTTYSNDPGSYDLSTHLPTRIIAVKATRFLFVGTHVGIYNFPSPNLTRSLRKNFSHLALLYLQSAPIPRKGERPFINLGDDTNFFAQFECAPLSSIIRRGVVKDVVAPAARDVAEPGQKSAVLDENSAGSVEEE